ncbi:hypothetical protein [Sphingomonas jaspsi]|uniref:hypothetical protein n=1 Tax=Sphingomonas jaspsi TaxID=392409 RepID=UPI0004B11B92|nr:hypothetical protein [Sphingomonas jaspsi]
MMWPLFALSAAIAAMPQTPPAVAGFQPTSSVSERATVTVRILHAARFGKSLDHRQDGAHRRSAKLADASGALRPAQLLEFE